MKDAGLAVALAVEWLARRCGLIRTGRPGVREEPSAPVLALRG